MSREFTAVAVIPSRFAAERLPGKPLLKAAGKYLVQHVHDRVRRCSRISRILVATDDPRIAEAVRSFGGEPIMTRSDHRSGTDRVAEVAQRLGADRVINVQGDEPEVDPAVVDAVVDALADSEMSTAATPLRNMEEAALPNRVKVVLDRTGFALYFSRSRIPYPMNGAPIPLLHFGVYGYTRACLERLTALPPSALEQAERLEQLRALENGIRIRVAVVDTAPVGGIDTPADFDAFLKRVGGS